MNWIDEKWHLEHAVKIIPAMLDDHARQSKEIADLKKELTTFRAVVNYLPQDAQDAFNLIFETFKRHIPMFDNTHKKIAAEGIITAETKLVNSGNKCGCGHYKRTHGVDGQCWIYKCECVGFQAT